MLLSRVYPQKRLRHIFYHKPTHIELERKWFKDSLGEHIVYRTILVLGVSILRSPFNP